MPDTVSVIILDEPPGSEFADTTPVERVKPAPLIVETSTSSLYVMVMVLSESTEAAVIRGGTLSVVPIVWSSAEFDESSVTVPDDGAIMQNKSHLAYQR